MNKVPTWVIIILALVVMVAFAWAGRAEAVSAHCTTYAPQTWSGTITSDAGCPNNSRCEFCDGDTITATLIFDPTAGNITVYSIDGGGTVAFTTSANQNVLFDDDAGGNTLTFSSQGTSWATRTRFIPDDAGTVNDETNNAGWGYFWLEQIDSGTVEWIELKDTSQFIVSDGNTNLTVQNIFVDNASSTGSAACIRFLSSQAAQSVTASNILCRGPSTYTNTIDISLLANSDLTLSNFYQNFSGSNQVFIPTGSTDYGFTGENIVAFSGFQAGASSNTVTIKNSQFLGRQPNAGTLDGAISITGSLFKSRTSGAQQSYFGGPNTDVVTFKYNAVAGNYTEFLDGVAGSQIMDADYNSMSGCFYGNVSTAFDTDTCSSNCPAAGASTFHAPCWDMTNFADSGSTCGIDESCVQNAQSSHSHLLDIESISAGIPDSESVTITFDSATPKSGDATVALYGIGVCKWGTTSGTYTGMSALPSTNELDDDWIGYYWTNLKTGSIPNSAQSHSVTITNLKPNDTYYYKCGMMLGDGSIVWQSAAEGTFTTPPPCLCNGSCPSS